MSLSVITDAGIEISKQKRMRKRENIRTPTRVYFSIQTLGARKASVLRVNERARSPFLSRQRDEIRDCCRGEIRRRTRDSGNVD